MSASLGKISNIILSGRILTKPEDLRETIEISRSSSETDKTLKMYSEFKVLEGLTGLTMLHPGLGMYAPDKIVFRTDHKEMNDKVKLLSGGSAGHDPLFTGFIGYGMLTAAVYGDEKGGPTTNQILIALREMDSAKGIIIIIKNNLDERLNFGLAMERARAEGILVDMVVVADDCWESQENSVGRRCLGGLVAVIKVAGAMSEMKKSMRDIFIMCRAMIIASLSAVFCKDHFVRFGTDINGIGGKNKGKMDVHELITDMMAYITDAKSYFSESIFPLNKFIVLVNSYRIDSLLLGYVAKELLSCFKKENVCVERMYCSTFISGPRPGICITLVKDIDEELLQWFDYAVPTKLWPESALLQPLVKRISLHSSHSLEVGCDMPYVKGPSSSTIFYDYCLECVSIACRAIISSEFMLNKMDPMKGHGSLVANGAKELLKVLEDNQLNRCKPYFFVTKIGLILEESILGATGTMYGLFFSGIGQFFLKFTEIIELDFDLWTAGIKKGIHILAAMTNIKPEECTLIDALLPLYNGFTANNGKNFLQRLKKGAEGAELGAQATSYMKSSRHLPELPEPGAQTVATVMRAIYETAKRLHENDEKLLKDSNRFPCSVATVELPSSEELLLLELAGEEVGELIVLDEEIDEELNGNTYKYKSKKEEGLKEVEKHDNSEIEMVKEEEEEVVVKKEEKAAEEVDEATTEVEQEQEEVEEMEDAPV
ncbi:triokinase/FMN cyclase-like isoform X2 [Rhodnius prolixus]